MLISIATILSVTILLGNSTKPQSAFTRPESTDGNGCESQVCPMCCQGPAATPGTPGLPGSPGLHGPTGSKGDAGEPGQKGEIGPIGAIGERGPPGSPGPKGDDGIGLPGKIGLRGPPGLVGPTGQAGVKGQRGEPGETPNNSAHRVAFTVTRTSNLDRSSYTQMPFQRIATLLPGTSFDLATGTFICNVPGTYVFMFSVHNVASTSNRDLRVHLRKNNKWVVTAASSDSSHNEQVSGSAVLVLQLGDTVYLTVYGTAQGDSTQPHTSFSGFILYG